MMIMSDCGISVVINVRLYDSQDELKIEIDRYIGLPIFFPIFKHFTIIGFVKKKDRF